MKIGFLGMPPRLSWEEKASPASSAKGLDNLAEPVISALEGEDIHIQNKIMDTLSRKIEGDPTLLPLYRLCSIELKLDNNGKINFSLIPPLVVPAKTPVGFHLLDDDLKHALEQNVHTTLKKSGQLDYLRENKDELFTGKYRIVVDVDFVYARPSTQIAFHKDTVGLSLFVNLNYNNQREIFSPEWVANPHLIDKHLANINGKLPDVFKKNLAEQYIKQGETEICVKRMPKHGIFSFVDELIHHSTPYVGHRYTISRESLDKFIKASLLAKLYKEVTAAFLFYAHVVTGDPNARHTVKDLKAYGLNRETIKFLMKGAESEFPSSGRVRALTTEYIVSKMEGRPEYYDIAKKLSENREMLHLVRLIASRQLIVKEELASYVSPSDLTSLFPDMDVVIIPSCEEDHCQQTPKELTFALQQPGKPPLKRQMSGLLDTGDIPEPSDDLRQILRTWVQAIPVN
jgi:hypothetical protein